MDAPTRTPTDDPPDTTDHDTSDHDEAATPRRPETGFTANRPGVVVALAALAMIVAGALGGGVADRLSPGGFVDPAAESTVADELVAEVFGGGSPDVVLVLDSGDRGVDDPTAAATGIALSDDLAAREDVLQVASYWTLGSPPPLASTDGTKALVLVRLTGSDLDRIASAGDLYDEFENVTLDDGTTVGVAGPQAVFAEINHTVETDLISAELIALPITALLLVWIFGSVSAAVLPLLIGGFSILGTFLVLDVLARLTDVSIFALNFTTAMGLGLAIDYALLIVNRYREELAAGRSVGDAVTITRATAGRTVLFSGLTVASALTALLVFPFVFLRSFAWAGFAVIALAVIGANVVLPAILRLLGHRVNSLSVRNVRAARAVEGGGWHRLALAVMRRPVPIAAAVIAFLLLLGAPFLRVELGLPDDRVLPPDAPARVTSDVLRADFDSREAAAIPIVVTGLDGDAESTNGSTTNELAAYAERLSLVGGVARVDSVAGSFVEGTPLGVVAPGADAMLATVDDGSRTAQLNVVPSIEPISPEAMDLVDELRAVPAPGDAFVGGSAGQLTDTVDGLLARLPLALGLIALVTFVVLFLAFGSVLMPIKAIALNLLSLTGTLGAMVWIYQDGRLEDLLGFEATGTLTATMPVLMFVIAFGLSMDYEVFLLSRIREEWLATSDPVESVARGLARTGRIVTAAAVLIAVVFVSFGLTASVRFMSMFGFGMTLAILVDAFLVRTTLVPAFMRLAGGANWWAPAPLRRFHDRYGFSEGE